MSSNDVVYVDNKYVNCSTGDGTQSKPFCELNPAVTTGKSYIFLKGNGTAMVNAYQAVTVDGGKRVAILGPGRDALSTQQAVISGVTVTGGSRLTLNGLSVTNNTGQPAVQCNSSATIYVKNALVSNTYNSGGGIYAAQCAKVEVERTKINAVAGNGIFLTGGSGHRIINNAITNGNRNSTNFMEQYGIRISGNADGVFSFNTIANNLQGILCDNSVAVTDSIVTANAGALQVSGCQASRIVSTGVVLDPGYTSGMDPILTSDPMNDTCCIDKGMPDVNRTIKEDYFGVPRPKGNGYDIGFHEAK